MLLKLFDDDVVSLPIRRSLGHTKWSGLLDATENCVCKVARLAWGMRRVESSVLGLRVNHSTNEEHHGLISLRPAGFVPLQHRIPVHRTCQRPERAHQAKKE